MMFSTLGLFKQIGCPAGVDCTFDKCLFSHDHAIHGRPGKPVPSSAQEPLNVSQEKGRGLDVSRMPITKTTTPSQQRNHGSSATKPRPAQTILKRGEVAKVIPAAPNGPRSMIAAAKDAKAIPKPTRMERKTEKVMAKLTMESTKLPEKDILQPRPMPNPPAVLPTRFKLLVALHNELKRLNKLVADSDEPQKGALLLSDQELMNLAMDEEEDTAIHHPKVYSGVMKNRIGVRRKDTLKTWVAERISQIEKKLEEKKKLLGQDQQKSNKRKLTIANQRIQTGLSYKQEQQILPQLLAPIEALQEHGYVTTVPAQAEVEKARVKVVANQAWEICDRCGCRFRAWPTRQADGKLTSGGSCKHHWGKVIRDPRDRHAKLFYSCCQLEQGQPGCEEKPCHVFKPAETQRLATVVQFESTPEASSDATSLPPVGFDCEMAYTSYGMELIRLTAVAWPSGSLLLDVLVRPKGEVLDLNTRFSGVTIEQWRQAKPWISSDLPPLPNSDPAKKAKIAADSDVKASSSAETDLPIVPSPEHARNLLFKLITPTTPLIGHSLENDLIAVRIVHPTIVDTVILFPHKGGLPFRNKLKAVALNEIKWFIQNSDAEGHDSLEDALAAGELVRHKVRMKWDVMKRNGWSFDGDELNSPDKGS